MAGCSGGQEVGGLLIELFRVVGSVKSAKYALWERLVAAMERAGANSDVSGFGTSHRGCKPLPQIDVRRMPSPQYRSLTQRTSTPSASDVIPAKAGIQYFQGFLDPGFRRGDDANHAIILK
mgnify:CR=1 FL=1